MKQYKTDKDGSLDIPGLDTTGRFRGTFLQDQTEDGGTSEQTNERTTQD